MNRIYTVVWSLSRRGWVVASEFARARHRTDQRLAGSAAAAACSLAVSSTMGMQGAAAANQFWDGANTAANNTIDGGSGLWNAAAANTNWTNANGAANTRWISGNTAIFQGIPGAVTVDVNAGAVSFGGLQFAADGYSIGGDTLTMSTTNTVVRVGDGNAAGTDMTATIASVIQGGGLKKTDLGTLILSATNTYTGTTTISSGALSVASPAALGVGATVTFDGEGSTAGRLLFTADAASGKRISVTANRAGTLEAAPGTALTVTAPAFTGNGGAGLVNTGGNFTIVGNVSYVGNSASAAGGALYSNGNLSLTGGTGDIRLSGNTAAGNGGAFYAAASRNILLSAMAGSLEISNNTGSQGGALYAGSLDIDGAFDSLSIAGNTGSYANATTGIADMSRGGGGAFYAANTILIRNTAAAGGALTIRDNTSRADGGALLAYRGLTIEGNYTDILIDSNSNQFNTSSRGMGGALRVTNGPLVIDTITSGSMIMRDNIAATFGGAMDAAYTDSTMTILGSYGTISLTDNQAVLNGGGALGVGNDMLIDTRTQGAFEISRNTAKTSGGALLGYYEDLTLSGTYGSILVDSNTVTATTGSGVSGGWGGAFFTEKAMLLDPAVAGDLSFTANRAGGNGGALATGASGSITLGGSSSRLIFRGNTAASSGLGGAAYTAGALSIGGDREHIIVENNTSTVRGGAFYAGAGFNLTLSDGATLTASGNRAGANGGGFLFVNSGSAIFDIGAAAVATIGNTTAIANGTDSIAAGAGIPLIKRGAGTLDLWGANTYTGATNVEAGTLLLNGSLTSDIAVSAGATLGGTGTTTGATNILDGAHLAPGSSPGALTVASLALSPGAQLDYELGQAGTVGGGINDLVNVTGALTLDGTLNVSGFSGFGTGVYRLIDYGGTLTDNGLAVGAVPPTFDASDLRVQTNVAGQVNLIVQAGGFVNRFWDGPNTSANGAVDGGTGTWNATATQWTGFDGLVNTSWPVDGFAIFQGTPGTVTVDNGAGAVTFSGAQFAVDGYTITGGPLTTSTPTTAIRVGNGTAAVMTAIIDAAIQGTGGIDKTDPGTLILTGANIYSGGTVVNDGTLQIGNGGTTGSVLGSVAIRPGAELALYRSANGVSLDADLGITDLSGAGVVRFRGTGIVDESSYRFDPSGSPFAGTLVVANGARLVTLGSSTADAAGIRVDSGGSLYLSDESSPANTYHNPIAIAGLGWTESAGNLGALRLGDGATASGPVTLTGDSRIGVMDATQTGTISGAIDDGNQAYALEKVGAGRLILTGNNTYTGGTTIAEGTLQIGSGGAGGSLQGDVTNNAALVFNRSGLLTFDGVISGSGTLTQAGPGTLTLTGANEYTGGTTIAGGALSISNDASLGAGGLQLDGGTLRFDSAFDLAATRAVRLDAAGGTFDTNGFDSTVLQPIAGNGGLTKTGAGTLTLAADSTYAGATQIAAGRLRVDGTVASPVSIGIAGTLGGNGAVGSTVNEGLLAPGASIGQLTINGDYIQTGTGTLQIELDDQGRHDGVTASGAAQLDGRVSYVPDPASTFPTDLLYPYLAAGGVVAGAFVNPTQEYAGVLFETEYTPDGVQLRITHKKLPDNIVDPDAGGQTLISCLGSLDARRAAAAAEERVLLGTLVAMPVQQFVDAALGACPRDSSVLASAMHAATDMRLGQLANRIAEVHRSADDPSTADLFDAYRVREGTNFWVRGAYIDIAGDRRDMLRQGFTSNNRDFTIGLDVALQEAGVVGGYLTRSDMNVVYRGIDNDTGHADLHGWILGLYGGYWTDTGWFTQGILEYGWLAIESHREVMLSDVNMQAQGERDARSFAASLSAGYTYNPVGGWLIQPQVKVSYDRFADDAYDEKGAGPLSLTYSEVNADTLRGEAGITIRKSLRDTDDLPEVAAFYGYANYVYDAALDDRNQTAQFAITDPFIVTGDEEAREGVRYGLGFENTWRNNAALQIVIETQDYGEIETASASLQFRKQF